VGPRAEQRGFAGLAAIDRLVYQSLDSIVAMSVAAGATTDIGLMTNVLLALLYPAALLAKQVTTLAEASGGRLALGLGVGSRPDDHTAAGVDYRRRGRILDETVTVLRDTCDAKTVTGDKALRAAPVRIPILFGRRADATIRRGAARLPQSVRARRPGAHGVGGRGPRGAPAAARQCQLRPRQRRHRRCL